jgi:hypothetical protein
MAGLLRHLFGVADRLVVMGAGRPAESVPATGQDPEADPALVAPAYATMQRALPATGREGFPFDPPVEPAPDAGPTERLANWTGRASR